MKSDKLQATKWRNIKTTLFQYSDVFLQLISAKMFSFNKHCKMRKKTRWS